MAQTHWSTKQKAEVGRRLLHLSQLVSVNNTTATAPHSDQTFKAPKLHLDAHKILVCGYDFFYFLLKGLRQSMQQHFYIFHINVLICIYKTAKKDISQKFKGTSTWNDFFFSLKLIVLSDLQS